MSGYTKHVYEEDLQETKKQLVKYVDDIIPLLSEEYDFDEILKLVKKYYKVNPFVKTFFLKN